MTRRRTGSIQDLGGGRYRIRVQRGNNADGTPRVIDKTYRGLTRDEAEYKSAELAKELGREDALSETMSLKSYFYSRFLSAPSVRGTPRSKSTKHWYTDIMERDVFDTLGLKPICRISHTDCVHVIQQSGSPANTKRALRAVLTSAYDDGLLTEKPFQRRITVTKRKRASIVPWTVFEASKALKLFQTQPPELEAWLILGLSGLRKSEALGVRPCDIEAVDIVDYATGEPVSTVLIHVRHTYSESNGEADATKNEASKRTVPVIVAGRKRLLSITKGLPEDERITRYSERYITRMWERALKELGLRYIPPKALRHTSDTIAINSGVSADLNDKMHGRTEHATTYKHYYQPDVVAMEQAARKVNENMEM